MDIRDSDGRRLYLTQKEFILFLEHAKKQKPKYRTIIETLAFTGCRATEALELTPSRVELDSKRLNIRCIKKRKDNIFRSIPVPDFYLDTLNLVHNISEEKIKNPKKRIWKWTRQHLTRQIVIPMMIAAGVSEGPHRTTKGLRHAFGINAVMKGIPLSIIQKWLGHSSPNITAIYTTAVGNEESELASKLWVDFTKADEKPLVLEPVPCGDKYLYV